MMEAKKHSPLPWALDRDYRAGMSWNIHIVQEANPDMRICFMTSDKSAEPNAKHIVHAANNIERVEKERDALLEALKKAKKYVPYGYSANPLHDEIDAAIASVEKNHGRD